jgi:hypothetical protein
MNTQPTAPSQLQPDHAKIIAKSIWPMLNYLVRLRERMEKTFPPTDPVYLDVCKAYDAMHALNVRLHYLSCKGKGIGEADEKHEA